MRNLNSFFHTSYTSLFYIIIFGTTLFFSTATRSVFEVNKLGIVKICLSLAGIFFCYDRLIGNREWFFNFKKNKTINITILLVWVSNALSTIFSKNIIISIFYFNWIPIFMPIFKISRKIFINFLSVIFL